MTRHATAPDTVPAVTTDQAASTLVHSGGTAALVVAGTYVVGFAAMVAYFVPQGLVSTLEDPAGSLEFLRDHHAQLSAWYFVLYLVGGAMAFRDGRMGVDQVLMVRPGGTHTLPSVRDW